MDEDDILLHGLESATWSASAADAADRIRELKRERDEAVNAAQIAGRLVIKATSEIETLMRERDEAVELLREARAESDKLKAIIGRSDLPCLYCGLPGKDMARCQHGFPGCGRADDIMLDGIDKALEVK